MSFAPHNIFKKDKIVAVAQTQRKDTVLKSFALTVPGREAPLEPRSLPLLAD